MTTFIAFASWQSEHIDETEYQWLLDGSAVKGGELQPGITERKSIDDDVTFAGVQELTFRIRTRNTGGVSEWISVTLPPVPPPVAPTNLLVVKEVQSIAAEPTR